MVPCGLRRSCRKVTQAWLLSIVVIASRAQCELFCESNKAYHMQDYHHHGGGGGGARGGMFAHVPAPTGSARLAMRFITPGLWTSSVVYHQNTQSAGRGGRRRSNTGSRILRVHNSNNSSSSRSIRSKMDATAAGGEGDVERAPIRPRGGPRPKKRPLVFLCVAVNDAILEMCVVNKGRPLAKSMTDFVEYSIEAMASGYSVEALLLELQLLDSTTRVPGETLTGVEKRYRTQWIGALHAVMQNLKYMEDQEPKTAEEFHIKSQVDVVLRGRLTNDEQTFVKFDKALATGGVAGGAASECIAVSPQVVPISQLILLAIRALQKLEDAAAA